MGLVLLYTLNVCCLLLRDLGGWFGLCVGGLWVLVVVVVFACGVVCFVCGLWFVVVGLGLYGLGCGLVCLLGFVLF